jgi:predicted amidohydrolase
MPRVAAFQLQANPEEPAANLRRVIDSINRAAEQGIEFAAFPECFLSGYNLTPEEIEARAAPFPGPIADAIAEACRRAGIYAQVGSLEKDTAGLCYNSAILVGPQGLVSRYRKTHLPFLGADRYLAAGDELHQPVDTPVGRLAMLICYDLRFPEPARALALQGAQVIVVSTAWPRTARLYSDFLARARAAENAVYLVAANRVGEERGTRFLGRSIIVAPDGEVLAEASPDEEAMLVAEIEPSRSDRKRMVFIPGQYEYDIFEDRRPELYLRLCEESSSGSSED